MYKVCVPITALKNPSNGYDKYGNEFKVIAIGFDAIRLWGENTKNRASNKYTTCPKEEYVAGVFPKSANPEQIHLMPYCYDGIMIFRSTSKRKYRLALKVVFHNNTKK